ncbi:MAG TPA: GNAT family N-acetyltransferase [Gaiella sp.]|nr:GNAT family N-acetyltransferase [Gaiella sp.]
MRLLREEAAYFSSRYEDAVREPDTTWRDWATQAAEGTDRVIFVAEDEEGWAGVVGAFRRVDPSEVQLVSMWVDPRARGRGVAQALIRAVASWAQDLGARRVVLFVQEVNAAGQALYFRAGFRATGDRMPVGAGRPGFKLVFVARVEELLAA